MASQKYGAFTQATVFLILSNLTNLTGEIENSVIGASLEVLASIYSYIQFF